VQEQAEKYAARGKALLPLRPLHVNKEQPQMWNMINMRAKEAERAALLFQKRKQEPEVADSDDMFFDA
jgi:hypothetical protein